MEQTNAAQQEPWWEEFTQSYGKESLRALAKRFGTNPRRLRRAAQRCGLVNEPPELLAAAERLGTCPDDSLAGELGVTPELVKGARLRRQIAAFNPKTLPQPRVRKPKKVKPPRPERPPRENERYSRSEPAPPTVVVKRTRSRVEPERTVSRVDEGARKLANTLGRIRSEETPSTRASGEPETNRRRRVVSAERSEEMRGLKPSTPPAGPSPSLPMLPPTSLSASNEGDGRTRRRRMPKAATRKTGPAAPSGGDDEPGGARHSALSAARISKALSRAAQHSEPQASPVERPRRKKLSKPPSPPRFVPANEPDFQADLQAKAIVQLQAQAVVQPPAQTVVQPPAQTVARPAAKAVVQAAGKPIPRRSHPTVEALLKEVEQAMSPVASLANTVQESLSPVASLASSLVQTFAEPSASVLRRQADPTEPSSAELLLWTAEYKNAQGIQFSVIAAPTFMAAMERASGLGELLHVQAAPTL